MKVSPPGSSGCIDFRAMVIRRQDYWYMNDGSLTYRICRDTSFVDPSAGQDVRVCIQHLTLCLFYISLKPKVIQIHTVTVTKLL